MSIKLLQKDLSSFPKLDCPRDKISTSPNCHGYDTAWQQHRSSNALQRSDGHWATVLGPIDEGQAQGDYTPGGTRQQGTGR